MAIPQVVVIALLHHWQMSAHASGVAVLLALQLLIMRPFLATPSQLAIWYSGFGIPLYVVGMLVSAFALRLSGVEAAA